MMRDGPRISITIAGLAVLLLAAVGSGGKKAEGGGGDPYAGLPQSEKDFCIAVETSAKKYKEAKAGGQNELQLSKLRTERKLALQAAVKDGIVTGWTGTLGQLRTTGDGKAIVEIKLPCGDVHVKTWNNALSDIVDRTLVPQGSKLYEALATMGKGKPIVFNGKLLPDEKNGFRESSLTEEGSMREPEFIIRLSAVGAPGSALVEAAPAPAEKAGGADTTPSPSADAAFTISKVSVRVQDSFASKGKYVRANFQAKAKEKPEKGTSIVVKYACMVDDDIVVEKGRVMAGLDDMEPGQSKSLSSSVWALHPLEKTPTSCTLTFGSGHLLGEPAWNMGEWCFTPPATVKEGACP